MAKNIVSQISVHQQHEFLAALERAGLTGDLAQRVIESRGNDLANQVISLIRGPVPEYPTYTVTVNYEQSVEQLVRDGSYDWANDAITSRNFPSRERGMARLDILLVNFNQPISSEAVIVWLEERGLRPATLKELLALGANHPDLQRDNPIVALGSIWRGPGGLLRVPFLGGGGAVRHLDLSWFGGVWDPFWRFAAVRK